MTSRQRDEAEASSLMMRFAERTGLTSERAPRRYLWTDAFAVCNLLALAQSSGEPRYHELALRLVDQLHHVLGRHRPDDLRSGWISGLPEQEGELHPTCGGLRIGKKLPERLRDEPLDERLEWDRDGQYFHYLTKWMYALDQVSRATKQAHFNTWARELADVAHRSFVTGPPGHARRMSWKMSIDLSRPLVTSMGHHDPLDGFITCIQLRTTTSTLEGAPPEPDLKDAVADFATLIEGRDWTSADPLGLGGLLIDACRVQQLMENGALSDGDLLDALLSAALEGLTQYSRLGDLRQPAARRLAFRELGLAIGISAVGRLEALNRYLPLGAAIKSFWRDPEHRRAATWLEHRDINEVMLASSLAPEGMFRMLPLS